VPAPTWAGLADGGDLPITIPRGPARGAAERELSKPVYHQHDPNLVQRAIDWFWHQADRLLSDAAGATPGGWVGLVVIAAAVVLAFVALRIRLGGISTPGADRQALFDDRPRTAAEHRAAAERHAAHAQWDDAVRERMRAIVRGLEERALLDPRAGRTADEAATEAARTLPDHAARLRSAARAFDDVCYGGRHATQATYHDLRALDTDLEHAKPRLTTGSRV
jgi:Domain of unknown function (DUF4129)